MTTKVKAADFFEKEMGPMTFGMFVTSLRTLLDVSQADLARRLKVSRSMICDIEKGRLAVSPSLAIKIARVGGFPARFAVKCCLQDQLRRAKIKMNVDVKAA